MNRIVPVALTVFVAATLSGCLAEDGDGGFTGFVESPDCPTEDFVHSDEVTVDNLVGTGRAEDGDVQVHTVDVASMTGWNAREAACVDTIHVDIEWTNQPEQGADLYVGVVVPGTGHEVVGYDNQQLVADGDHLESVLAPTALDGFTGEAMLQSLEVHIHSDWASLSQSGLPVTVTVTLGV